MLNTLDFISTDDLPGTHIFLQNVNNLESLSPRCTGYLDVSPNSLSSTNSSTKQYSNSSGRMAFNSGAFPSWGLTSGGRSVGIVRSRTNITEFWSDRGRIRGGAEDPHRTRLPGFFLRPNLFASCNNTFSKWWEVLRMTCRRVLSSTVSIGFGNLVRQRGKEAYKLKLTN
jgi:hypothetical protein